LKKLRILALVLLAIPTFALSGRAEVVDRIVAFVNDEVITLVELDTAFETYRQKIEESY